MGPDSSSETTRFRVEEAWAGRRLDEFLAGRLPGLSRMHIAGLLARGACRVGGAAAHAGRRLRAGEVVEVESSGGVPNSMTPEPVPLEVVYEDGHLLVVVKPSGVLVHPTLADPLPGIEELQVVDASTLRVAPQPSFGPAGERMPVERDGEGQVVAIRWGGVTSRRIG